jgi:glycosyltransferase involved in cell wall biosynthesis
MRILMLTQWFTPEPDFKGLPFAKELVRLGHEVQVLTGFPNYPGGKVYDGYNIRPFQREVIDGIPVIRVPLYPSHDTSSIRRILNYISFALSAALLGPLLVKQADVVYVYHAPATIALPAMVLKILRRIPFVYDINDLWPDSLAASNMFNSRFLLKCVDLWCGLTYRMASHIVVAAPGFKVKLLERGIPESKIDVIYNWCNEVQQIAEPDEDVAREPGMSGRFNLVFAGTMGKVQALDSVIDAAKVIAVKLPQVQFVFIGGGVEVERLKTRISAEGIVNCLFLPRRPVAEIGPILSLADVLLVHLQDAPLFEITIPSKTAAYMAVGRPILMAVRGDSADLLEEAGAGITCIPEDTDSIASAVERLAAMSQEERDEMGRRGVRYYQQELSLAVGARRFEIIFDAVVQK